MIYRYRMYFLNFFYKKKITSIFHLHEHEKNLGEVYPKTITAF